jgi:hypothetical protein
MLHHIRYFFFTDDGSVDENNNESRIQMEITQVSYTESLTSGWVRNLTIFMGYGDSLAIVSRDN